MAQADTTTFETFSTDLPSPDFSGLAGQSVSSPDGTTSSALADLADPYEQIEEARSKDENRVEIARTETLIAQAVADGLLEQSEADFLIAKINKNPWEKDGGLHDFLTTEAANSAVEALQDVYNHIAGDGSDPDLVEEGSQVAKVVAKALLLDGGAAQVNQNITGLVNAIMNGDTNLDNGQRAITFLKENFSVHLMAIYIADRNGEKKFTEAFDGVFSDTKEQVLWLEDAIIGHESNHNYKAVNPDSGALGYGQVMPSNLTGVEGGSNGWDIQALGRPVSRDEFLNSPELQKEIIRFKLNEYLQHQLSAGYSEDIAVMRVAASWYAGPGNADLIYSTKAQPYGGTTYISINGYAEDILARYETAKGAPALVTA